MSLIEMSPVLREAELESVVNSIKSEFSGVKRRPIGQDALVDEVARITRRPDADVVLALGRIQFEYCGGGNVIISESEVLGA